MKRTSLEELVKMATTEQEVKIRLVKESENKKTGNISQTYTSEITCPCRCPYRCSGCYGEEYHTGLCWSGCEKEKFGNSPENFPKVAKSSALTKMVRLNIAGDIAKPGTDNIDPKIVDAYIKAFGNDKNAYSYTHCEINEENVAEIKRMREHGIIYSFSCEKIEEVKKALENGCDAVLSVETMEDRVKVVDGIKFVKCPNSQNENIKCANCGICAKPNRKFVIVFPLHGTGENKAKEKGFLMKW